MTANKKISAGLVEHSKVRTEEKKFRLAVI